MLDIVYYTSIDIGVPIPLELHISKVRDREYYIMPQYKTMKYDTIEKVLEEPSTDDFFYGKFRETLQIHFILERIYEFIDVKNMKLLKYLDNIISTKEDFINYAINSFDIDITVLRRVYEELLKYIQILRERFMKEVIGFLEIDKQYPDIELDDDISKTQIFINNKEHLQVNYQMITYQNAIELSGFYLFSENKDKSWNDFSWREKEFRRLYMKKKHDSDNFVERLKAKAIEENRAKAEKNATSQNKR